MTASPADRSLRFLHHIAPNAPDNAFAGRHVELVAHEWTPALEAATALAITLLLRLDVLAPVIHLRVPDGRTRSLPRLGDGRLIDALAAEHDGFCSALHLTDEPVEEPAARIVFGGVDPDSVTVDGWRVAIGSHQGASNVGNGLAAAYAGVLAANDIFQKLLIPFGARIRPFRGAVSLWDLKIDGDAGPSLTDPVDLDGVAFAACGGVASATGWALAVLRLSGGPVLVDPDHIDDLATNLNRHLTASFRNLGESKAQLLGDLLRAAGAEPLAIVDRWSSLPATRSEIIVATPDHDAVRRQAQLDLPRLLLSGGTADDGVYQVSRHDFLDRACAGCICRADMVDNSPIASAARHLGLTEAELAPLLENERPLPKEVINRLAIGDEAKGALTEVRGRDLLQAVCGAIQIGPVGPALSAPTLAAAPGVLVAAELVKERLGAAGPLNARWNTLMTSVLSGPHERWVRDRGKRPGCECTDEAYISYYKAKWSQ